MAAVRIPADLYNRVAEHLLTRRGEHFAFLRAGVSRAGEEAVFLVHDVILIPDDRVRVGEAGYEIEPDTLLEIVNTAIRSGDALIEAHNHGGTRPRFSRLDHDQLDEFVPYILESLSGRPYAATVWGDDSVFGVSFEPDGGSRRLRSISISGPRLRQLADDDQGVDAARFDRQLPWFTERGQRQFSNLRIAIVGLGGTGSPVAIELAYLGLRDFVLIDSDSADETSMNRLLTAGAADLDTAKTVLAQRAIRAVGSNAEAQVVEKDLRSSDAIAALKGVDVIFGCVDNDGARLILNELAIAYRIPYFDLGVGIQVNEGKVVEAGGRVAAVIPGGPCLLCMDLIDRAEAAYFLSSPEQQAVHRERGYVRGMEDPAPAVVSLNTTVASAAISEFAVYVSGIREISALTVLDVLGHGRHPGQWLVPERVSTKAGCVHCAQAGNGDRSRIDRYASSGTQP